jgi:lysophospholipase L1-like esterase
MLFFPAHKGKYMPPKVVLIGDSIRMGYLETVKSELTDEAEIWSPVENCGPSTRVLENLDRWAISQHPDVIHINCGLHDLRRDRGATEAATSPAVYAQNLRTIFSRFEQRGTFRVVFALTTPVNEAWHQEHKDFDRFEADVKLYNNAALNAAAEFDVAINDLFTVIQEAGPENCLSQDGVHFNENGYNILGRAVAGRIRTFLD